MKRELHRRYAGKRRLRDFRIVETPFHQGLQALLRSTVARPPENCSFDILDTLQG